MIIIIIYHNYQALSYEKNVTTLHWSKKMQKRGVKHREKVRKIEKCRGIIMCAQFGITVSGKMRYSHTFSYLSPTASRYRTLSHVSAFRYIFSSCIHFLSYSVTFSPTCLNFGMSHTHGFELMSCGSQVCIYNSINKFATNNSPEEIILKYFTNIRCGMQIGIVNWNEVKFDLKYALAWHLSYSRRTAKL